MDFLKEFLVLLFKGIKPIQDQLQVNLSAGRLLLRPKRPKKNRGKQKRVPK